MQAGPLGASSCGDVSTSGTHGTPNWMFMQVETDGGLVGAGLHGAYVFDALYALEES